MAKLHPQVAAALQAGYAAKSGDDNPHLWSSATWEGWELGKALRLDGAAPSTLELVEATRGGWFKIGTGRRWKCEFRGASGGFYWRRQFA